MTAAAASTSRLPLAHYPTDETLSERLKGVVGEWDGLRRRGIGKFLLDEYELAERLMLGNADSAVRNANDVMGRDGASSSSGGGEGEGGYLLKKRFQAMATAGEKIPGEMRAVWQVMDVSRAARGVEGRVPAGGDDGGAITSEGQKSSEVRKCMRPDKGEEERRQVAYAAGQGEKEMRPPVVVQQLDRLHYIITIFINNIESYNIIIMPARRN
jgi:hypothetical protein